MQLAADRNMLPFRQHVLIGGLHVRHFNLAEPAKYKLRSREPPLQPLAHLAFWIALKDASLLTNPIKFAIARLI